MSYARDRYHLTLSFEVVASTLPVAVERVMRLFRGRVRKGLKVNVRYQGFYRGSWITMARDKKTNIPENRVNLAAAKRKHKLRRKRKAKR